MRHQLTITAGPDFGARYELTDREALLIGRGETCGVQLSDPSISRVHCRLIVANGKVILEDAGSRWGTQVNGIPVETRELQPGDVIAVGDTELRLDESAPAQTTIAPGRRRVPESNAPHPLIPSTPHQVQPGIDAMRRGGDEEMRGIAAASSPRLADLVGESFLQYRVNSVLARSDSGMVFRTLDTEHNRTVALKVFWPEFFADEQTMLRFLRAMKTMLPLEHEHLIRLYAAGRRTGLCYTASEYVEGESVSRMIERVGIAGMLDWRRAYHVALGVAEALEFAHEHNIVHRNLKPSNVVVRERDDCVKLGDLMYAKALDERGAERITRPGEVVGDVCYLSPEQVSGAPHIDARADIYSLGAMLYAILTGRPPFEGSTAEVIGQIVSQPPEPPTRFHLAIPSSFEGVVLRMLAKRPDERFVSTTALLKDLRRVGKYQGIE